MRSGDVLAGKYRLERVLGEGATGQVWWATPRELARPGALKVMHQALAGRRDAQLRFLREARVAACLHHPGAVRILDFGNAPAGMFLQQSPPQGQIVLRAGYERPDSNEGDQREAQQFFHSAFCLVSLSPGRSCRAALTTDVCWPRRGFFAG